jgi:hypothetical protein
MANLEALGLDRKRVDNLAIEYEGYGRWSSEHLGDSVTLESATSIALAAVYRCLIEPRRAKQLFQQAGNLYRTLHLPYWIVLAVCGTDDSSLINYRKNFPKRDFATHNSTQFFYELLATSRLAVSDRSNDKADGWLANIIDNGYQLAPNPVGRLSLPLRFYLSLFATIPQMQKLGHMEPSTIRSNLSDYLRRISEVIEAAQLDHYHWTQLQSGILPVEPEVLATCGLLDAACKKYLRINLIEFTGIKLRPIELVPLQIALELSEPPKN